ncbi:hypothetical protein LTR60_007421, partial [Cryomyces antarcticus]
NLEFLARIRDVVVTRQAALAEQAQDRQFKGANDYDSEDANGYADDSRTGGFAGSDTKKRRGVSNPFLSWR